MARLPSNLTYNDLNGQEATEVLLDWVRQLLAQQPLLQPHLTLPNARMRIELKVDVEMYTGGTVPVASAPDVLAIHGNVTFDNNIAGSHMPYLPRDGQRAGITASSPESRHMVLSAEVNAAPVPGGQPPDQIRESHGLPVPRPGYGPRDTGSHLYLADIPETFVDPVNDPAGTGGRRGDVAPGYMFSSEAVTQPLAQEIPVDQGRIEIDLKGDGIRHESGMLVKERAHRASVKDQGDQKGASYSSVNGVYDPGPRGLMQPGRSGGYGTDGRPRIGFGNQQRG